MALDTFKFETLIPSQFITFTIPNPINHRCCLRTSLLRIAVLDSPATTSSGDVPTIAAMIVPDRRETDWTFCTESGHLQLLFNFPDVSRLILIGNNIPSVEPAVYIRDSSITETVNKEKLEEELKPLVIALHPKLCFRNGLPETLFLTYEDDVLCSVVLDRYIGPFVGEFLVEDVKIESDNINKQFRRRLRFKRMPNLIQSQVRIINRIGDYDANLGLDVEFIADTRILVQPYLTPMVSGLFLIVFYLNDRIKQGFNPKALCLGVGGGVLLSFLNTQLGFDVIGVEADEVVLKVARKYFGLNDVKSIRLVVGDAIELIDSYNLDDLDAKFDVVMVDLDSSEAKTGISAPPLEFVKKSVLQAVRSVLYDQGVLIVNVIPPDDLFYATIIREIKDVFHEVYEIDVENGGNFVLVATLSQIREIEGENDFLKKMKSVVSGAFMESIMKL